MSYTLYKTNGLKLTTVEDGSLENSTDLTFVGKNYSGYGSIVNQNLVKLLENFAGKVTPVKSLVGQVWYDTTAGKLKVNIGSYYKPLANIESSNTQPSSSVKTDLWYNESTGKLNFFDGTAWVVIGPQISGATLNNQVEYASVADDNGVARNILQHNIQKTDGTKVTVAISSPVEFIVNSSESIKSDYYLVKKGITLPGTNYITGVGTNGNAFWGNASNALKLNGFESSEFVKNTDARISSVFTSTNDLGFDLNNTTRIRNDVDGGTLIANIREGNKVRLQTNIGGSLYDIVNATSNGYGPVLLPTTAITQYPLGTNLGDTNQRFNQAYFREVNSYKSNITTSTVMTILPRYELNAGRGNDVGVPMTLGSAAAPFDAIYATNVYADSVSNLGLVAKTFNDSTARDAYYVANPGAKVQGLIVLTGTSFQGWNGASWVNLN